jgi:hypothetical protein
MSKYVPRFLAAGNTLDEKKEEKPADPVSRWPSADPYRVSPKKLVNTSLPAKMAPHLPPATLASITKSTKSIPLAPSDNDFPSLGGTKATNTVVSNRPTFSELSKAWAKTQKEDEAHAKLEAEKEARRLREQTEKEKKLNVREEARKMGIHLISMPVIRKKVDGVEEDRVRYSDSDVDSYGSEEFPIEEEEEEEEEECDWNTRKHRDELY